MAVDDDAATFWASKFDDTAKPVDYIIDLGDAQTLASIDIAWQFPAKAFTVSVSADGSHFSEVYATDANVLKASSISLGSALAKKLRVSMIEPNPVHARFQGHLLYGIKSMSVYADRMSAVLSDCGVASKSSDARDKYFLSYVTASDPAPASALRSELPALEAAQASLSATVSELADILPHVGACGGIAAHAASSGIASGANTGSILMRQSSDTLAVASRGKRAGQQGAFDQDALDNLLQEARASIVGVRKVLA